MSRRIMFFLSIILILFSCHRSIYQPVSKNMTYASILELDTVFYIEKSFNFFGVDDVLFGKPVAVIAPSKELTKSNYFEYKRKSINILYSSIAFVPYDTLRKLKCNPGLSNNITDSLIDDKNNKYINLSGDEKFTLIKKRLKVKCFLIGYDPTYKIINPRNGKIENADETLLYGICSSY